MLFNLDGSFIYGDSLQNVALKYEAFDLDIATVYLFCRRIKNKKQMIIKVMAIFIQKAILIIREVIILNW